MAKWRRHWRHRTADAIADARSMKRPGLEMLSDNCRGGPVALTLMDRALVPVVLVALVTACAPATKPGGRPNPAGTDVVVTAEDIAAMANVRSAWDVVQQRFPQRYRTDRGGASTTTWRRGPGSVVAPETPLAFLDGLRLFDLNELERVPAATVRSIRIVSAIDGTTMYGSSARGGVVLVQTRGDP